MPYIYISLIFSIIFAVAAHAQDDGFPTKTWQEPDRDCRMKTWWFFGYEHTDDDGIRADVEALRKAGFGGVVYYDQNHAKDARANGAEDAFSAEWWRHLRLAATEARKAGLTFEVNISNGYCAGGRWIDPQHAMQRVQAAECVVQSQPSGKDSLQRINIGMDSLLSIKSNDGYVRDIAVVAFPAKDDDKIRHFTARYNAKGKGRNGAMQGMLPDVRNEFGERMFTGYGFETLPDVGTLQASDDSITWCDVVAIKPMYRSQGGYFVRTSAFPGTHGKYWRVKLNEADGAPTLKEWSVGSAAKIDRWEERTGLHSDFDDGDATPQYSMNEVIRQKDIIDLTDYVHGDSLTWLAPKGSWRILRLAAVTTGAKSKHGRQNLLGYECDKLSAEAANLHWDSYTQVIIDSLGSLISGITMDSHEGGAQNWTPLMMQEFRLRRGYSLAPFLPVLAGYIVESAEKTAKVLYDFRQTISDCIRENYFGTFQKRCTDNRLTFTAQAIGNALCMTGDAVSVKQVVDKPQGEFWTYQRYGAYDVKDCSSAAHLYGKPIASAEAMTDCEYKDSPLDLMRVCNIAFSMGAQEFVVCATPHIPHATVTSPYIAGREYAINRSNPKWQQMKPVWTQAARSMVMLRQGMAAPDVLVFLGDDVPVKTITSRLPAGLDGLDWDVCTGDALHGRLKPVNGALVTPDGISYKALLIADKAHVSEQSRLLIDSLSSAGVPILSSGDNVVRPITIMEGSDNVVHTHRKTLHSHIFYIASTQDSPADIRFSLIDNPQSITLWRNLTGKRRTLHADADGTFRLSLQPQESVFVTYPAKE